MTTSVIYELLDALVEQLGTALDPTPVFDSYPDTDDPGLAYLVIGVPDPINPDAADSAVSQQEWANVNHTTRDEEGDVTCAAVYETGDGTAKDARTGVKTITDAVEAYLREHYTLGLAQLLWVEYGANTTLQQDLTDQGAIAQVIFTIHFRARTHA